MFVISNNATTTTRVWTLCCLTDCLVKLGEFIIICFQLFYRSVGIISKLGKVEEEEAREALLKAIYKEEDAKKVSFVMW